MLRALGIILITTSTLAGCFASHGQGEATTDPTVKTAASVPEVATASPSTAIVTGPGFEPDVACHFLSSNPMFAQGGDYTPFIDDTVDDYSCGTTYFQLGGPPGESLANNISYYGRGTAKMVKRVNVLLNVNDASAFPDANAAFKSAAVQLFQSILKREPDSQVLEALKTSTPGTWLVGSYKVQILRDSWKSGRGYSLNFVIGDPAFSVGF